MSLRIAVDAMGGDRSPQAPVAAAAQRALATGPSGTRVLIVGREEDIRSHWGTEGEEAARRGWLELVPASEAIGVDEAPVVALRQKPDASIVVGLRLVREGRADAFVSAGSTGALMAGAFRHFGRIPGVPRPALATVFPCLGPGGREFLLLDLGANVDARPEHLRAYGVMGAVYAEAVMGRPQPRVGLLNNGTESSKGNELTRSAHALLAETPGLSFAGNVEARDAMSGRVDVLVTDGFTGNIAIKLLEGVVEGLFAVMKDEFTSSLRGKLGALMLRPAFRAIKRRLDYAEYGGAPFLGLAGACIKCHGSSNVQALLNGLGVAERYVNGRVVQRVADQLAALGGSEEA